ncbi:beta-lactamase hydrolase domain-containing protein [Stenotrophomonas rhizophila]
MALPTVNPAAAFARCLLRGTLATLIALAPCAWASELPFAQPRPQLYSAGQPSAAQLHQAADAGVRTVIDLRQPEEDRGFDETAAAERLGLRYVRIPVAGAAGLTEANARALHAALENSQGPVLVHCASGNRAGALLALLQARQGASLDQALEFGRKAGMTSLEAPTRARIEQAGAR